MNMRCMLVCNHFVFCFSDNEMSSSATSITPSLNISAGSFMSKNSKVEKTTRMFLYIKYCLSFITLDAGILKGVDLGEP